VSFKILVVEDNRDTRELLHLYFTNANFAVVTAVDGQEGIHKATTEHPDAILTDLSMPNLNGIEMIKVLRRQPETANMPILVFTARGSSNTKEAMAAGADQTFYKPFDFDALVEVIRSLLQKSTLP
jgi:two-component system, OmpR family, alkaline phosphatase synthesis response regulator PhoP